MCLGRKLSDSALRKYKAKGKKTGYIRVWKVVTKKDDGYFPQYKHKSVRFKGDLNKSQYDGMWEETAIHAFRDKKSAKKWAVFTFEAIITCLVKPEWVLAIGETVKKKLTLTTRAIVMPAYPKTRATVKQFRQAVKEYESQL